MDNCLIFPKLETKHIYIIIFVISSWFRVVFPDIIQKYLATINDEKYYFKIICFFDMFANFFGDISVGLYKLVNICIVKKKKDEKVYTSIEVKTKKEMLKIFFMILPLIAFIDILAQLCLYIFSFYPGESFIKDRDLYFLVGIDIFFRYIFSRIFLKSSFYKHHYLSMVLTFIGFLPLMVINIIALSQDYAEYSPDRISFIVILSGIRSILYSLEDVFNKIALNKLLLRPYELMFYKAVFEIIPIIIIFFITKGFSKDDYFSSYFEKQKIFGRLFYRLCFIICNIGRTIALITIIEKINPNHLSVLKSMEFIGLFIYGMFGGGFPISLFIIGSISCIIIFIGSIIHNEMIIINKWGFYKCTDYYKTEVKSFSNVDNDVKLEDDKNKKDKSQDSLLGDSSINQE